ncbi:MAG: T9SS type A sorting domain-containing protein [Bacteroidia bacterium]|nr:T9SS type A sorting domain-containing protein [Bacteroidia bacterium]
MNKKYAIKKLSFIISCFLVFLCTKSHAQAQWKFHLAFEDATGAKDTIWLIWDTSAVLWDYDPLLGEGHVDIDLDNFSTWVINYNNDTTKTTAEPFISSALGNYIYGTENFQSPLTLSWDSSLFHAPNLPQPVNLAYMDNGYFFGNNNCPFCHHFDMLIDNHVTIDLNVFPYDFFPVFINIERGAVLNINENISISKKKPLISPNPASYLISIKSDKNIKECSLIDNTGIVVLYQSVRDMTNNVLSVQDISSGVYVLKIINQNNEVYYEKIIITH